MSLPSHLSARELASMRLPGLPASRTAIHNLRLRNAWAVREEYGRLLIEVASLPEAARAAIAARLTPRAQAKPVAANDVRSGAGRPAGTDYFTRFPEVADTVTAIVAHQQLSATGVMEHLIGRFDPLPHIRTLRRFIARIEVERRPLLESFRDPDLYKSRYRVALGRADGGVTHANQVWEIDSTRADVILEGGRRQVLGLVDVYSRRASFMIAPSESGQSVRRLLIKTITAWGVLPAMVKTDNGSGFINASVVTALGALGIEHHRVAPGSGDKKPHIERIFGTLTRERFELLPGYSGHSVAEAQKLRGRAKKETGRAIVLPGLNEDELQAVVDNWLEGVYHSRVHGGTGMSPLSRYAASPQASRPAPGRDALLIALSALVGTHIVTKRGIVWKRGRYWAPELVPFIGRPVQVRRDEEELGALFVFAEDGRYIATAVNHLRAGISEAAFAAEAQAQQRQWMKEARAQVRERGRDYGIDRARDAIFRRDAEAAGKLAYLPAPANRSESALQAVFKNDAGADTVQAALVNALPPPSPVEPIAARAARAQAIIAEAEAGYETDPARLIWARAFIQTPAFKTFITMSALRERTATIHQLRNEA